MMPGGRHICDKADFRFDSVSTTKLSIHASRMYPACRGRRFDLSQNFGGGL
jgi:hypothetical protein